MDKEVSIIMPRIGELKIPPAKIAVSSIENYKNVYNRMKKFCINNRRRQNDSNRQNIFKVVATSDIRTGYIGNKVSPRLVITIRPSGCEWCKKGGGCMMCGHYHASTGILPDPEIAIHEIKTLIGKHPCPTLCVYNEGSMLNANEISFDLLKNICKEASQTKFIKKIVFESRPEFVKKEIIYELLKIIRNDQKLVIAIGVETTNDYIRDLCINKGFAFKDVINASEIANNLLRFYVFFGVPFLSELEIIYDTYKSILDLSLLNPEEIHVEPSTIQDDTIITTLWKNNEYKLPSLWSIVCLLKLLNKHSIFPYISPFNHFPMPKEVPTSCPKCREGLIRRIDEYYNKRDIGVFDDIDCQCIDSWHSNLLSEKLHPYLDQRIKNVMNRVWEKQIHIEKF